LQECDDLPALWLGQLRPDRHAVPDHSVGQDPEERAGCGLPHLWPQQAGASPCAAGFFPVAFSTVLFEELSTGDGLASIAIEGFVRVLAEFGASPSAAYTDGTCLRAATSAS